MVTQNKVKTAKLRLKLTYTRKFNNSELKKIKQQRSNGEKYFSCRGELFLYGFSEIIIIALMWFVFYDRERN